MGNEVSNCCGPTKDFSAVGAHYNQTAQTQAYVPVHTAQPHELRGMFHSAAERGDVQRLANIMRQKKVHLDDFDQSGNTALHKAAWHGHLPVCRVLVKYGANVRVGNRSGKTALNFAVQRGNRECAQYLEDIVSLPDPAEVKRKFRAKVKTSNCARVFGPRASIRGRHMLIPGVPESQCQDDHVCDENDPTPFSDARWGAKSYAQPNYGLVSNVTTVHAPRPELKVEVPARRHTDYVDDAFYSGRLTDRAESNEGQKLAKAFPSPRAQPTTDGYWQVESPASRAWVYQSTEAPHHSQFSAMSSTPRQPVLRSGLSVSAELGFTQGSAPLQGKPVDIWGGDNASVFSPSGRQESAYQSPSVHTTPRARMPSPRTHMQSHVMGKQHQPLPSVAYV